MKKSLIYVKSILFKAHVNMNAITWGSGDLQPLVAKISITTRNTTRKMSLKFFPHLLLRASVLISSL